MTTYTYDDDGNLVLVEPVGSDPTTMVYDYENRLVNVSDGADVHTYTYSPAGLKRTEDDGTTLTTLVWDGDDYLMERS